VTAPALLLMVSLLADASGVDQASARFTTAVRGELGLASVVGFLGLTASYAPHANLVIEGGAGYGVSGLQLSLMPKLVLGSGVHRFTVGFGASIGIPGTPVVTFSPTTGNGNARVVTPWLNADLVGYDYRSEGGFSFIASAGATMALAHGCAESIDSCFPLYGAIFPQLRVGFGHWF
jgi:hypothetical protein